MSIRHKRTSTSNYTWLTTDLVEGQIGLNLSDGTLHFKLDSNDVVKLSAVPTNVSAFTNDAGYITSFTETDPVFQASAAAGITAGNISTWDSSSAITANLATVATTGAYSDLTGLPTIVSTLDSLSDVEITSVVADQVLRFDGTKWINASGSTPGGSTGQFQYNDAGSLNGTNKLTLSGNVVTIGNVAVDGRTINHAQDSRKSGTSGNTGQIRIGNGDGAGGWSTSINDANARVLIQNRLLADGTQTVLRRSPLSLRAEIDATTTPTNNDRTFGASMTAEYRSSNNTSWTTNNGLTLIGAQCIAANNSGATLNSALGQLNQVHSLQANAVVTYGMSIGAVPQVVSGAKITNYYGYITSTVGGNSGSIDNFYGYYIPGSTSVAGLFSLPTAGITMGNVWSFYNESTIAVAKLGAISEAHEVYQQTTHSGTTLAIDISKNTCHEITLGANITELTFTNISTGTNRLTPITVIFKQDATGGRTVAWPAGTKFANAISTVGSASNEVTFASVLIYGGVYHVSLASFI